MGFGRRLTLRRSTNSWLKTWCFLAHKHHRDEARRHACGLESVSHQQNDEAASKSSGRERRDRSYSCKDSQGSCQHARQKVLADLNQKKSMCSDVEHDADTRDGLAGSGRTDASEPQYTSVTILKTVENMSGFSPLDRFDQVQICSGQDLISNPSLETWTAFGVDCLFVTQSASLSLVSTWTSLTSGRAIHCCKKNAVQINVSRFTS